MHTEKDKIKDIFSSKLANFEANPPQDMWNRIAENLPVEELPTRSNKIQLYRRISIVSAVAAAIVISFVLLLNDGRVDDKANKIAESLPVEALNPDFADNENVVNNDIVSDDKKVFSESKKERAARASTSNNASLIALANVYTSPDDDNEDVVVPDTDNVIIPSSDDNAEKSEDKKNIDKTALEAKIRAFANQGDNIDVFTNEDNTVVEKSKKGISLSLAGNTGFSKSNGNKTEIVNSLRNVYAYYDGDNGIQDVEEILSVAEKELPAKATHRQPVSFGLTVSKDLSSRFSIETGVVYTYLSSKIRNKPNTNLKRSDSQYFHYLGVPVSLNYNFAKWNKAEFYVSAGGMIQKDFYGLYKEDQMMLNNREDQNRIIEKTKIHQNNPQFSVLGKIGVSYPIVNKIHAYATVGGAYYFDAGHEYKIIYSDKKMQLDLNIGLKFKF